MILTAFCYLKNHLPMVRQSNMDRRRERRWQTEVNGSCLIDGRQDQIAVTEISTIGCRVQGDFAAFGLGDTLQIFVGNIGPLDGTLRWTTSESAGVEFRDRLDQAVVAYFAAFCRTAAQRTWR